LFVIFAGTCLASEDWKPVRKVEGVPVESRPTDSGFNVHRGVTSVCANLTALEGFVADTSRFPDWIPFTRSARLLDESDSGYVYYVRSTTPWPLKDRDMVYRIAREKSEDPVVRLVVTGLPDYQPPEKNAERIRVAAGEWRLEPIPGGTRVSYELYVDPGSVPAYFANRRLATVVGQTLANLAAQFPCTST
jgi:hypothetical protein